MGAVPRRRLGPRLALDTVSQHGVFDPCPFGPLLLRFSATSTISGGSAG
jgi:hypothetical protein